MAQNPCPTVQPMSILSRRHCLTQLAGAGLLLWAGRTKAATDFTLAGSVWERTGAVARLDPYLLYAIGFVESRQSRNGLLGPWPYAVRTPAESYYPDSFMAATRLLATLPKEQITDSDLGWMQVNVRWHGHRVPDLTHLLHPDINLRVGTGILREALASAPGDAELAIGRYHTWADEPRGRAYGARVLSLRRDLRMLAGLRPDGPLEG